nr:uncharacterized protein LOC111420777 [Onthophagus taurus]
MSSDAESLQARWSDIQKAYEVDTHTPLVFRSLYKLKDYYFSPLQHNAMKVKIAAQTLSRSSSVYIYQLVQKDIHPARAMATACFIALIDELFNSCNGSAITAPDGKPYKCQVTSNTGHNEFWDLTRTRIEQ